jgi:outer membrane murein-binding lipoprotein Lpp
MKKITVYLVMAAALVLPVAGCMTRHKIEVAPMHITIDVNIKVDRALDNFFGDLDAAEDQLQSPGQEHKNF